ncbi:MAG: hypothetical protein BalsKO_00610 [Balneolaceae bacterium]
MNKPKIVHGFSILIVLTLFLNEGFAQQIIIDEDFSDWDNIPAFYEDASGDNFGTSIDFKTLKITNDDLYIYLYLEVGDEINLQQNNSIALLIDLDSDSETGQSFLGLDTS